MTADFDAFYTALEDRFRGDFDLIKQRARVYLDDLPRAPNEKVLDLGCGRGEWLDLMKEVGLPAQGVDMNQQFAAPGTDRGLNIQIGDIFEVISSLPAESFTVVTAFHVIEHLPFQKQLELLTQSQRLLRPGGILIVEWPNTENWSVMSQGFWLDPTHVRPVPMALMAFMAEYCGFDRVVQRVHRRNKLPAQRRQPGLRSRVAHALAALTGRPGTDQVLDLVRNAILVGEDAAIIAHKRKIDK